MLLEEATHPTNQYVRRNTVDEHFLRRAGGRAIGAEPSPSSRNSAFQTMNICEEDAPLDAGPVVAQTMCLMLPCFKDDRCYRCSGAFVADPTGQGQLLLLTVAHCIYKGLTSPFELDVSTIQCDRTKGNGTFPSQVLLPCNPTRTEITLQMVHCSRWTHWRTQTYSMQGLSCPWVLPPQVCVGKKSHSMLRDSLG